MGPNRQNTDEKEVRKIMYFRNFYDRDQRTLGRHRVLAPADTRTLNDEIHEFCLRPLAKAFFNHLYNHKPQPGWGPDIGDTFELISKETELAVCGRRRPWHAAHDDCQGPVKLPQKHQKSLQRKRKSPAQETIEEDQSEVDRDPRDGQGKRARGWQSEAGVFDLTDASIQSAGESFVNNGTSGHRTPPEQPSVGFLDDDTFLVDSRANGLQDNVKDRTKSKALNFSGDDWSTLASWNKKMGDALEDLETWLEYNETGTLIPGMLTRIINNENKHMQEMLEEYSGMHDREVSRHDWDEMDLCNFRMLAELCEFEVTFQELSLSRMALDYLSNPFEINTVMWGILNVLGRTLEHCDSERDEAGYGVYNATELGVLLTEAYRFFSIYEVFKAARPTQLTVELAELAALRLSVEHYNPEGLDLRFKLANTPFRQSNACLADGKLLLRKGREFVKGTFKRWPWDHWGGQSLPLDACHAIAREKHFIERRKIFAIMGLLKASDTTFDGSSPASVEGVGSWKPDVGGSNNSSEGGNDDAAAPALNAESSLTQK
ncbi:hypothetical protein IWX90DRAFT_493734 [Phyllosticta citrichinensis]|uniref:Uncharacterized protein n=1 Tax=Phyllosticta citrichinensis TaxID=1130410 RepID=A0ABR1XHW3_9PEZI